MTIRILVDDDTQQLDQPKLKNLYGHVRDVLPNKGQRRKKKDAKEEHLRAVLNHHNPWNSTTYVNGRTTKESYAITKSHVNNVPMESQREGICAKTLEELPQVVGYVKNDLLGCKIPCSKDDKDRDYVPDFVARVRTANCELANLIIEITGFNKEKEEKKWTVEERWLTAVNALRAKHPGPEWYFIEVEDILNIRPLLTEKIEQVAQGAVNATG